MTLSRTASRAALITPALLLWGLSFAAPLVIAVRLSLFDSDYLTSTFVGLGHYGRRMLDDRHFVKSFVNSFFLVLFIVPPMVLISYTVAAHISDYSDRIQSALRFAFYVPGLAAGIVMALIWRWLLDLDGLLNQFLAVVGIGAVPWLIDAWPARAGVAIISVVTGVGGNVLILSAVLCGLPPELRDASRIDGASDRQYRRYIIRPFLVRTVLLVSLLDIIGVMQIWEVSYVLFKRGGPEGAVASPVYEIFLTAFFYGEQGYAAAKGIVLAVVIAVIIAGKQRIEAWAKY
jgi:ABC-type sugar transport system permease subunit